MEQGVSTSACNWRASWAGGVGEPHAEKEGLETPMGLLVWESGGGSLALGLLRDPLGSVSCSRFSSKLEVRTKISTALSS